MTQGIDKFFGLPPLDEILKEKGIDVHAVTEPDTTEPELPADEEVTRAVTALRDLSNRMTILEGTDHSEAMDDLYKEICQHARDLMSYGYNVDMPRQRGIFEIAMIAYGHALSAKNSKRDAQLKAMRLALDRRKVDLEEKRTNHVVGQDQTASMDSDGTIVVEDRNELIKRLREQLKNQS